MIRLLIKNFYCLPQIQNNEKEEVKWFVSGIHLKNCQDHYNLATDKELIDTSFSESEL